MSTLEFIFSVLALFVGAIVVLCLRLIKYNYLELEEENKKLKERLIKREYKKVKIEREEK